MTATQALGWALVHSLWQCALAAAGLAWLLSILPSRAARIRYALATATLVLMVAVPLGTALSLHEASPWHGALAAVLTPAQALAGPAVVALRLAARVRTALEPALPEIVALWVVGVIAFSLRLASGWMAARRLAVMGTHPAPPACEMALERLAARLRVTRPLRVLESALVQVPAVVGWLRPVILVPASALTGLTPLQLDALLAHEIAHVRRHDYIVRVLQSVIETLLFYHPAVWWVSRRVGEEREHCCDDLAVAVCGDAHMYAQALVGMERLRGTEPAFVLTAARGSLVHRVRRLVEPAPAATSPPWVAGVVVATLLLVLGVGSRLARVNVVAANHVPAAPDTLLRHHESARPPGARFARGETELRPRIARSGMTSPNPPFSSMGLAPLDIRRSPADLQSVAPRAFSREPSTEPRAEALADATNRVGTSAGRPVWHQPVLLGSLGVILTGFADRQIRLNVQEEVQEDDGGEPRAPASSISHWSTPVTLGIGAGLLAAGLGTHRTGLARTGRDALVAVGVASLLATTANITVGRAHPEANRGTDYFTPFQAPSQNNSFPSGNTSRAFALAAVVAAHTRQPVLRVTAYGAAAAVGIAQLVADRHFASDVVAGAVLGTWVGQGVVRHFATASTSLGLAVTPLPGRVGIALNRNF